MKDHRKRLVKAFVVLFIGLFFTLFYFLLFMQFGRSLFALFAVVFICFFKGFLYILSYFNRKKYDHCFEKEFNLDIINKLNRNLNIIDNINKYSLLVFYIVMGIVIFIATDYDFYSLIIIVVYIALFWNKY